MNFQNAFKPSRVTLAVLGFLLLAGGLFFAFTRNLQPGPVEATYQFQLKSEGSLQVSTENPEANLKISTDLVGTAHATIFPQKMISLRWKPDLRFTVNDRRLEEQEMLLGALGEQRIVLKFSAEGKPEKIYFQELPTLPPSAAELVVNTGKMLILQLAWNQNQLDSSDGIDFWGSHKRTWKSKKQVETISAAKTQSGVRGTGNFEMEFDSEGHLKTLHGTQSTAPDDQRQLGNSLTTYQFTLSSVESSEADPTTLTAGLIEDVPWIVVNSKAMMRATLTERTKGWDLDRVFKETESLIRSQKTSARDLLEVSTKLQELLWLEPKLAGELTQLAIRIGPKHPLFDEILKAMTWVGDEASQQALQTLLSQYKSDESAAIRVMVGMAFVNDPNLESQKALENFASDAPSPMLGRTAELMLGQMANQLQDSDLPRAEEIQSRYVRQLQSPRDSAQVRHALNVIGNTGICKDYQTISQFVGNEDPEIHSRALEALRYCEDSRVSSLILNAFLKSEQDRALVIKVLEMRAQRSIFDADIFSTLLQWVEKTGSANALAKPTVNILGQLARLNPAASSQFLSLRERCEQLKICSYF